MNAVTPSGESAFNTGSQKFIDGPKCNCPNSCDSTEYREDISKVRVDPYSTFFENLLKTNGSTLFRRKKTYDDLVALLRNKINNKTSKPEELIMKVTENYQAIRNSYSLIHIYFKDLGGVKYSREELYGIMDLIGKRANGLCMSLNLIRMRALKKLAIQIDDAIQVNLKFLRPLIALD